MRPFLTSLFRKKRTLSLPFYALLFICFASESFDGYFYLLYCSYIFASIFSAFCDLRLMNICISIIASSMSMSFFSDIVMVHDYDTCLFS